MSAAGNRASTPARRGHMDSERDREQTERDTERGSVTLRRVHGEPPNHDEDDQDERRGLEQMETDESAQQEEDREREPQDGHARGRGPSTLPANAVATANACASKLATTPSTASRRAACAAVRSVGAGAPTPCAASWNARSGTPASRATPARRPRSRQSRSRSGSPRSRAPRLRGSGGENLKRGVRRVRLSDSGQRSVHPARVPSAVEAGRVEPHLVEHQRILEVRDPRQAKLARQPPRRVRRCVGDELTDDDVGLAPSPAPHYGCAVHPPAPSDRPARRAPSQRPAANRTRPRSGRT